MRETANAAETRQQEDTITLEHSGFTIQASMAEAGKAVDLGVGVDECMAYDDEDEDEDHEPNGDDLDQDEEDDLDEDDLDEDEGEEEKEDEDDDDLGP